MRTPITVSELIAILQSMPQDLPVSMSMNMEYQSRVTGDMVEIATRSDDGSQYVLITDTPEQDWDDDFDGQPDEAQEWESFDPDC